MHTRKIAPPLLAVLALCGGAVAWWANRAPDHSAPVRADAAGTPVIVYLVDTLRADRLGLYGGAAARSPHIDALAADSVVFDRAYGPAPWTLPSVASLLTSTFACEHGVVNYRRKLNPNVRTLAERLGSAGYATGSYFSNLHLGDVGALNRGFTISEERKSTDDRRAADVDAFVDAHGMEPFLLYVHTMEPHEWFSTPTKFMGEGRHVGIDQRETLRALWFRHNELRAEDSAHRRPLGTTDNTAEQREIQRYLREHRDTVELLYDSAVRHADSNLGEVIETLKKRGIWDRAVFVLLADHGEELGDHGGWFHDQAVYEELVHVPLVMHFPRGEFGGQRIEAPVSLVDVMPTLLDYVGRQDLCEGCRGTSLMPVIDGSAEQPVRSQNASYIPSLRMNDIMYFRPFAELRGNVNVVLRDARWKGIWNAGPARLELYDLAADPREQNDLSAGESAITAAMTEQAQRWLAGCASPATAPEQSERIDDRAREGLRAMGYFN